MRKRKPMSEKLRPLYRVLCTLLRSKKTIAAAWNAIKIKHLSFSGIYDRFILVLYNFTYTENCTMNILEM